MQPSGRSVRLAVLAGMLCLGPRAQAGESVSLVDRLIDSYAGVTSVTCDVRREETSPQGKTFRTLSRVFFMRPDRLHVDMTSPVRRTIVADGERFYSHVEGDAKGFSKRIADLDDAMLLSLRKVPGTGLEHLLHLKGVRELDLEPEPEWSVRKGYDTGKVYAELRVDASGRLGRVDVYTGIDRKTPAATILYKDFMEGAPGAWFARTHETEFALGGTSRREIARFDNLRVNEPIAPVLFIAAPFFKGIEFVDSFQEIYR
jgi:hypothetical protein